MVQVVLETPIHILVASSVLQEAVHESEMVSVLGNELCMGVGCLVHPVFGPQEDVRGV